MKKVSPFLLFQGNCEEAMNYYADVFPNTEVIVIEKYGEDGPGENGTVYRGSFRIMDLEIYCTDSISKHDFDFNPAVSFFLDFSSEDQLNEVYEKLLEDGETLMEKGNYGFSQCFAWVQDKFKITWQLNLPL